ncbi:hypothetical protein IWQ47_000556 [Aquimarina sp. EL_43]|uniref:hypothetical protein n=1 Tax=Aquimarina TaxID=290174 RepID=UPI0004712DC6|nr:MULTISPECIES: hypothetical protein [Aquimarina]MBG6128752.1 hypothetical protein [Aquimarina sp. EL_35]MBG6149815.1 hypothetical protein [Aquimarina sp. EL_32]MBG6167498.1 hypothetical protein [Aquimarina sp. EL_43]
MYFKIKAYLRFLSKSTNQHGVHSPFVYNLVTQCFYNTEKRKAYIAIKSIYKKADKKIPVRYRTAKLLNRILSYFDIKTGLVLTDSKVISEILSIDNLVEIDHNIQSKNDYDMIYLNINQLHSLFNIELLLSVVHNDSVIILNSIYESEDNTILWKTIQEHPKITVTIDTFHLGFVFIRNEQAKEHFTIRA